MPPRKLAADIVAKPPVKKTVVQRGSKPVMHDPYDEPAPVSHTQRSPLNPAMANLFADLQESDELQAARKTIELVGTVSMQHLVDFANELRNEKETIDQLEAEIKVHKDRYNELRQTIIPDMMKQLGIVNAAGKGSFTFQGGKIHLETTVSASCSKDNEPTFFAWARQNGAADLIKTSVNAQTLSALIRERRADGYDDPPGVAVFEQVKAKLTVGK